MRKRFRGNRPIATSVEVEGEKVAEGQGGMLYAGRGSYEGVGPKATDGRGLDEGRVGEEKWVRNDGVVDVRKT